MAEGTCVHIGAMTTVKHAELLSNDECVKIHSFVQHVK